MIAEEYVEAKTASDDRRPALQEMIDRACAPRTGTTNRQGRSYSYYSCAGCQQKGKSVGKGRHIPAGTLDGIVLTNLKQRVLAPDRIADLLKSLIERQAAKSASAGCWHCRRN